MIGRGTSMSPGMLVSPSHTTYCSEPMVQLGNGPTPVQVLPENFANVVQMLFNFFPMLFKCFPPYHIRRDIDYEHNYLAPNTLHTKAVDWIVGKGACTSWEIRWLILNITTFTTSCWENVLHQPERCSGRKRVA